MSKNNPSETDNIPSLKFRIFMAIAIGLAILFFVIYFWSTGEIEATAPLTTTSIHSLPDQSLVVLNDGSSIKYVKGTWEEERNILLVGEAFFNVKKGNTFQVQTDKGIIEAVGTKFNVRAWGDKLYVECYEGSVQVINQQQTITLVVNQSCLLYTSPSPRDATLSRMPSSA